MNRTVASRLLAKAIAYFLCGKIDEANANAQALVHYLRQCGFTIS